jgi:hypothetical protein
LGTQGAILALGGLIILVVIFACLFWCIKRCIMKKMGRGGVPTAAVVASQQHVHLVIEVTVTSLQQQQQ